MNRFVRFASAVAAAGVLAGCAQPGAMQNGMMMGQMPMMGDAGTMSPEMNKMMMACMQHMQAMSAAPRDGDMPSQPPTR